MQTTLLLITKDPWKPWKRTQALLDGARAHGLATSVWLDESGATAETDRERLWDLQQRSVPKIHVHSFVGRGYPLSCFNDAIAAMRTEWVLSVSDDEFPSEALWRFAADPPAPYAFRVNLVSILPDGRQYLPDQHHARIFPREGTLLPEDKFEIGPRYAVPLYDVLGLALWHYCTHAPREEREKKVVDYLAMEKATGRPEEFREWYPDVTRKLYLWEDFPTAARELSPELARQLPRTEVAV